MLKFLIYFFAAWFFFRVIRRLFTFWLLSKAQSNRFSSNNASKKSIKDLEEAEFLEIKDPKD